MNTDLYCLNSNASEYRAVKQEICFIRQLLDQAKDPKNSLLEQLQFLCQSSLKLDELFENSSTNVMHNVETNNFSVQSDVVAIHSLRPYILELVHDQYSLFNNVLLSLLEKENIFFLSPEQWSEPQKKWLYEVFTDALLPVLTPIGLDMTHPFPRIQNKCLCFIVSLKGKDAFGRDCENAFIQAPLSWPDSIQLPGCRSGNGPKNYVLLSSVIEAFVNTLFNGLNVVGIYQFRVTRSGDKDVVTNGSLSHRGFGEVVRLEVSNQCPAKMVKFLCGTLNIQNNDVYLIDGPLNLSRFSELCDSIGNAKTTKFPFALKMLHKFTVIRAITLGLAKIKKVLSGLFTKSPGRTV